MRGYEMLLLGATLLDAPGYESPCGVMSASRKDEFLAIVRLRIPMRGYETLHSLHAVTDKIVTNPHAGL